MSASLTEKLVMTPHFSVFPTRKKWIPSSICKFSTTWSLPTYSQSILFFYVTQMLTAILPNTTSLTCDCPASLSLPPSPSLFLPPPSLSLSVLIKALLLSAFCTPHLVLWSMSTTTVSCNPISKRPQELFIAFLTYTHTQLIHRWMKRILDMWPG